MKSIILINKAFIILLIILCSCSKEQKNNSIEQENMNQIINTKIKGFNERPFYQIKVKSSGVNFDIRINDYPVFNFFRKSGGTNMEQPINNALLNSGKQYLTVKVYPIKGRDKIYPENKFSLILNKKNDAWIYDNEREIILTMPEIIIPKEGLPFWEYKAEFDANVPYNIEGWKNSKKIEELSDIQTKLSNIYNKLKFSIEQKNNEDFINLTKNKVEEEAVSLYEKQDEVSNGFQPEKEIVLPFNNCRIKFYGNGKLVRMETEDGESCLKTELMIDGKKEIYYYPIMFHMPSDKNEFEVIR